MAAVEGHVAEFSGFPNFEERKRKSNLLISFPKVVNQMGSFGEKRKKKFFSLLSADSRYYRISALNLLDLLTVKNIYKLKLLNFTHQCHFKKLPNIFSQHFCYASEVHTYNTRYASKSNFYKPRFRTNIEKQTTSAMATEMWQQLPTHVKNFSTHNFPKKLKEYLLAEQLTY